VTGILDIKTTVFNKNTVNFLIYHDGTPIQFDNPYTYQVALNNAL
jgi:hypothetical protein